MGPYSVATYATSRQADPRLAARTHRALGPARSVVNVGAGAGSYEQPDLEVIAVEPSEGMIAQRSAPALQGFAESLPLPDDAAMAILTHDCSDGFLGAYRRRPAAYLDPLVRASISCFEALGDRAGPGLERLRQDLASGAWADRHSGLLDRDDLDIGYRLVVASLA